MSLDRLLIQDRFAPEAPRLRAHFESRFKNPRRADGGRFVWDYWHVPGQYTHLRTPAWEFFPKADYEKLHRRLVLWGREKLGCHDISPPWLSCYVDGNGQQWHGDLPHGPWAFVLSLTRWEERRFTGGETVLLRDSVLDYWSARARGLGSRGLEKAQLTEEIPAKFNRLVVFDPRIPHGVAPLRGPVDDVREGRLVIHGWFVNPRPFIEGSLAPDALSAGIAAQGEAVERTLVRSARAEGMLSFRLRVAANGRVAKVVALANTLRADDPRIRLALEKALIKHWRRWRFPKARGASSVTVPVQFSAR